MKLDFRGNCLYLSIILFIAIWIVRGFSGHYETVEYHSDIMDYVADASFLYNLLYVAILGIFSWFSLGVFNSRLLPRWVYVFILASWFIGLLYFTESLFVHDAHFFPLARAALNPLFLIMFFIVFAVYDDSYFQRILTLVLCTAIIFVILDIYVFITDVQGLFVRGHTPLLQFRTGAYWGFIFYMSFKKELSKRDYFILLVGLIWCTVVAFVIVSRSWCIQGLLSLLLLNWIAIKRKQLRGIVILMIIIISFFLIPYLYESFQTTNLYDIFEDKMGQDTRSMQYVEVFKQMPAHYFILGNGFHTEWVQDNVRYSYIDNQTIMFLYRYGFLPTLTYYIFLLTPIFRIVISRRSKRYTRNTIIIFLWLFAINGLSIFNTLNWDWSNFLVAIACARLWSMTNIQHYKYEQSSICN